MKVSWTTTTSRAASPWNSALRGGARATKDVDIGLAGERSERLQSFRDALALGFDEFRFQLKGKPLSMDNADAVRLELGVLYSTRAWQTIDVDLGQQDGAQLIL